MRAGFSLIEALVALALFEIGILALVASGAVAARDLASANRRTRARVTAEQRVERLRATACGASVHATAELPGGITEFWRVEGSASTRVISDSVEYLLPAGTRSRVVIRGWMVCR